MVPLALDRAHTRKEAVDINARCGSEAADEGREREAMGDIDLTKERPVQRNG